MERVVFFGSPAFALASLDALAGSEFKPVLVVTQPDKPTGRGRAVARTPVHERADRIGIPVAMIEGFRSGDAVEAVRSRDPDFLVVVSFGKILPREVLSLARKGNINVHASLLPRYRGASPINRAIIAGDLFTGVTTMEIVEALDAGPVFLQKVIAIDPMENAGRLSERLAEEGASILVETLLRICTEGLKPVPQPEEGIVKAPLLRKEDGCVPWELDALSVHNHIRGMNPWPGSFSYYRGVYLKIHAAAPSDMIPRSEPPGRILEARGDGVLVACGRGAVSLMELQAPGKRALRASDFLRGFPLERGEVLGPGTPR